MYFKIILSLMLSMALINIFFIGKERDPYTPKSVFLQIIVNGLIIYGLWNWL